jgi:hypothetical protein
MKKSFLWVMLFFTFFEYCLAGVQKKIVPFTTDYCTGYPEGTLSQPRLWAHCCLEHDLYYWAGGTKTDCDETDLRLRTCVEQTGAVIHARIMYMGVRLGKKSPIKFETKKWGNGWGAKRSYEALTSQEVDIISAEMRGDYRIIPSPILENFLNNIHSRMD